MVVEGNPSDVRRVWAALRAEAASKHPDVALPLRDIASRVLDGDTQKAAAVLAALDAAGYVRTVTMGWYVGWVTPKGRQLEAAPDEL